MQHMQEALKSIIDIQELDMKMLRLMRIKRERQKELKQIDDLRIELRLQLTDKEKEIHEIDSHIRSFERRLEDIARRLKSIEERQNLVKKADEFNALAQEMSTAERERVATEQKISDLVDKKNAEEELLEKTKESLKGSEESSHSLEKEIHASIGLINTEGLSLKAQRDLLAVSADQELLQIYERLLRNKKDRVIVPIENRTCSGCHITLTAQHENIVRKGENLVFCEHCSRIHYWQQTEGLEGSGTSTKRRRRRTAATA